MQILEVQPNLNSLHSLSLQVKMKLLASLSLLALVCVVLSQPGQKGEVGAPGIPGVCSGTCGGGGTGVNCLAYLHNKLQLNVN